MKNNFLFLLVFPFVLWGCSGGSESKVTVNTTDTTINYVDKADANIKKVELKSAIIHMKSSALGVSQSIVIYMDNFGNKQATELTQEMFGKKIKQRTLNDTAFMYSYNMDEKQGKKTKLDKNNPDNINFNAITREIAAKFKIKKTGTAEILGKKCQVFSVEYPAARLKATNFIYKGIPLKVESSISGISITMEATKIEENVAIDPVVFEIPTKVIFNEVTSIK
ncbi:MAG: hypothetical protein WCQ95_12380 [Bacteroidota bacterium]